ncbi:MAG: ATP-binding protein [Myxococcales bacterium]
MRKLHLQIYLAFIAVVVVCVAVAMLVARAIWERDPRLPPFVRQVAHLIVDELPEGQALPGAFEARMAELRVQGTLWSAGGDRLAGGHPAHPLPDPTRALQWVEAHGLTGFTMRLRDGRMLTLTTEHEHLHGRGLPFVLVPLLLVVVMAAATWPIARRITARLEKLERGVERFGQGRLDTRVHVEGRDEVADLARAFNAAADRIDALIAQHKRVLASASHELRAPLSRLRMALELLLDPDDGLAPERRAELLDRSARDIEELDALVSDLLLAARLENPEVPRAFEPLSLDTLVAEEAERGGVPPERRTLEPIRGEGDPRLLRRMVRNLIDNARRHGGGEVELRLEPSDEAGARLTVLDRGPGVTTADAGRIFEPFYRPQGHAEARDGGVGLGLSLVRHVAEHHGGRVRYRPREGGGSRFEVELPGFA